jgi:hypothetical protein
MREFLLQFFDTFELLRLLAIGRRRLFERAKGVRELCFSSATMT